MQHVLGISYRIFQNCILLLLCCIRVAVVCLLLNVIIKLFVHVYYHCVSVTVILVDRV